MQRKSSELNQQNYPSIFYHKMNLKLVTKQPKAPMSLCKRKLPSLHSLHSKKIDFSVCWDPLPLCGAGRQAPCDQLRMLEECLEFCAQHHLVPAQGLSRVQSWGSVLFLLAAWPPKTDLYKTVALNHSSTSKSNFELKNITEVKKPAQESETEFRHIYKIYILYIVYYIYIFIHTPS